MGSRSERERDAVNKIFGESLPQKAAEDHDESFPDDPDHDRWLRENTPPHHE